MRVPRPPRKALLHFSQGLEVPFRNGGDLYLVPEPNAPLLRVWKKNLYFIAFWVRVGRPDSMPDYNSRMRIADRVMRIRRPRRPVAGPSPPGRPGARATSRARGLARKAAPATTCFVNRRFRGGSDRYTIKLPGTPTRDQLARARPHGSTGANTSPRQVKSIQDDTVHTVPARQNDTRTDHNRHRCLAPIAHGGAARRIPLTTRAPWRAHGRPGVGRRVNTYT